MLSLPRAMYEGMAVQSKTARASLFALTALAAIAGQPVVACVMFAPFEIEEIRQADVVFSGELIRYEIMSPGRPGSLDDYGLLTVRVGEVLKGEVSGDVQLYWWNSTFGVPQTIERPNPLLIAAIRADRKGLPLRAPSATTFPTRRPDLLQVLQAPCSGAFILPYSQRNAADVRATLRGERVEKRDFFATAESMETPPVRAVLVRESSRMSENYVLGIFAIIAAGFIATFAYLRGRRIPPNGS